MSHVSDVYDRLEQSEFESHIKGVQIVVLEGQVVTLTKERDEALARIAELEQPKGPTLDDLDRFLNKYHAAVWDGASDEIRPRDYDLAGNDEYEEFVSEFYPDWDKDKHT